jgi:hypothetical protein
VVNVAIDGVVQEAQPDELLIDLINRSGVSVPHVCYHPQLGPVQTCDTCMVEVNGRLVRACATGVAEGMRIFTKSAKASAAQVEAFDRILSTHLLYCAPAITGPCQTCCRAIRNLLFWRRILGSIEPEWFQGIFQAIPEGITQATAERDQPVRLFGLLRRAVSKDSLRGPAAAIDFLQAFGRNLHSSESQTSKT